MISNLFGFLSNDIGIDLGTANTLVFIGTGVLYYENLVLSRDTKLVKVCAVGSRQRECLVNGTIGCPMKDGVIADFEISEAMLRSFIEKVDKRN